MAGPPGVGPKYPTDPAGHRTDPGGKAAADARAADARAAAIKISKKTAAKVAAARTAKAAKDAKLLSAKTKAGNWDKFFKGGPTDPAAADSAWDPLAGEPGMTPLTAFPNTGFDNLPDGSDIPDDPAHAFKSNKASLVDPGAYGAAAQKSYQPIIDALTKRIGGLQGGIGQANSMMDTAFGGASDAALKGAQAIQEGNAKSNLGLTDLAARMAQAAGGDPLAAAAVGQATANQVTADQAQANTASQAESDQAQAAQRDLGTAKLAYKGRTDTDITDLISKVAATKTEGSQAKSDAVMKALGFNSDQKTAQQGRDLSAQEGWLAGQMAGPQITAGKLANERTRAGMMLDKGNAKLNAWTTLNGTVRQQYLDKVTKWTNHNVANQMKDALAAGKEPKAELALADPAAYAAAKSDILGSSLSKNGPLVDPGKLYTTALTRMKSMYGDSQPLAIKKLAQLFAQEQINSWNAHHSAGQDKSGKTWKMVNGAPALVKK
jgi:hypothetical protein